MRLFAYEPMVGTLNGSWGRGELHSHKVNVATAKALKYLCRIVSHLHAKAHANRSGIGLSKVVLLAKSLSAKLKVSIRTRERYGYQLARLLDIVEVISLRNRISVFLGGKR